MGRTNGVVRPEDILYSPCQIIHNLKKIVISFEEMEHVIIIMHINCCKKKEEFLGKSMLNCPPDFCCKEEMVSEDTVMSVFASATVSPARLYSAQTSAHTLKQIPDCLLNTFFRSFASSISLSLKHYQ